CHGRRAICFGPVAEFVRIPMQPDIGSEVLRLQLHHEASMPQTFTDVACTVCGCVCDDLRLTFAGNRLTHTEGACKLAEPWFAALSSAVERPPATIEGKPATLE